MIRVTRVEGAEGAYRVGAGTLRLERHGPDTQARPLWLRPPVALSAILVALLSTFALVTRSGPAIGTSSVAILALVWLVSRGEQRARAVSWVELDGDTIRAAGDGEPVTVSAASVTDVRVGVDGAYRSVFCVAGDDRVPLLFGLDEAEAAAARDALAAAL